MLQMHSNILNRRIALINIRYVCPPLSNVLINTYHSDTGLYIDGETEKVYDLVKGQCKVMH